jgi:hypothetical protein
MSERIEELLEQILEELQRNNAAMGHIAEVQAGEAEPLPVKTEPEHPTIDALKNALMIYAKAHTKDAAVKLLHKYKSKKASDVPETDRAALIADLGV